MIRTLYGKLALSLVVLLTVVGLVYGGFTLYSTRLFVQELNQRFNRDLARQLLVERAMGMERRLNGEEVKGLFGHFMHINPAIEIYLLDTDGNILAFEAPQQRIKRESVDVSAIQRFLSTNGLLPIFGDDPRHESRTKVFSAAQIPFSGPAEQYLYVVLGGEQYDTVVKLLSDSYTAQFSIGAVTASVLVGLIVGLLIFALLTRRLRRLAAVMELFRTSGFRAHRPYAASATTRPGDEIDQLGATFDAMAARIMEQVEALEHKDALRRNLVANVSHDLRTPLAVMQGYLETLTLKGPSLPEEERQRFLNVAFRQCERLTRLVAELFELTKLDAREAEPQREPVAIGELLQDVAQQFASAAESQGIRLTTDRPDALPQVGADIALLNRVLENLIANAIEHTPSGGDVHLGARAVDGGVLISVTNSGTPISPEELPHLYERFYQAPEHRSGKGAGLGLAIVKRILELHRSRIEVTSDPQNGTTFSFTLPVGSFHEDAIGTNESTSPAPHKSFPAP